jgi:hypothetical protein
MNRPTDLLTTEAVVLEHAEESKQESVPRPLSSPTPMKRARCENGLLAFRAGDWLHLVSGLSSY